MEWQDEAIVLVRRALGETSTVAELFTRSHGRHLGLARGSRSLAGILQPGNLVGAVWRARLSEQLGTYKIEPIRARMGALIDDPDALAALRSICALAAASLPEREPHPALFEATSVLIDHLTAVRIGDALPWPALLVRWELGLLNELGFGLDLTACAVTGTREGLAFVSPRTGRAVSHEAGAPLAEKLFRLPAFLLGAQANTPDRGDIREGLRLTGHFIESHLLAPHGKALPAARVGLAERFKGERKG